MPSSSPHFHASHVIQRHATHARIRDLRANYVPDSLSLSAASAYYRRSCASARGDVRFRSPIVRRAPFLFSRFRWGCTYMAEASVLVGFFAWGIWRLGWQFDARMIALFFSRVSLFIILASTYFECIFTRWHVTRWRGKARADFFLVHITYVLCKLVYIICYLYLHISSTWWGQLKWKSNEYILWLHRKTGKLHVFQIRVDVGFLYWSGPLFR